MKCWFFFVACDDLAKLAQNILIRSEEAGYIQEYEDGVKTDKYTLEKRLKSEFGSIGGAAKLFDGDPPLAIGRPESSDEEEVVVLPSKAAGKRVG